MRLTRVLGEAGPDEDGSTFTAWFHLHHVILSVLELDNLRPTSAPALLLHLELHAEETLKEHV